MKMPTLYVRADKPMHRQFDALQIMAREELSNAAVAEKIGHQTVKRVVEILDMLTPANMDGDVAIMPKRQHHYGKIATILSVKRGTLRFDPSLFGGLCPHPELAKKPINAKVTMKMHHNFTENGAVFWKDTQTDTASFRSAPVLVLDDFLVSDAKTSVLMHEIKHVDQCLTEDTAPVGYFESDDSRIREELEAYHQQAMFDTGRIEAGLIDPQLHTQPRTINFERHKANPPAHDPFRPTQRVMANLARVGVYL